MLEVLSTKWWVMLVRGIIAFILGILAFIFPTAALLVMVLVFGAYAFLDGVLALTTAYATRPMKPLFVWLVIEGIAGIVAGTVAWLLPSMTALALLYLAGAWAIVTGAFQILGAIAFRKVVRNEWMMAVAGAASIILGILLVALPTAGLLVAAMLVAGYAVVFGFAMIVLGFALKGLAAGKTQTPRHGPTVHPI